VQHPPTAERPLQAGAVHAYDRIIITWHEIELQCNTAPLQHIFTRGVNVNDEFHLPFFRYATKTLPELQV
jgi:hypothetical protein